MKKYFNWDNTCYIILIGLIIGQITIGFNFVIGELVYVITDILVLCRDFAMKRPVSDKIKNSVLTALATGAMVMNI